MDEKKLVVWDPDRLAAERQLEEPRLRGVYRSPDLIWRESLLPANARFIGVISRLENLLLPIHVREAHLCIQDPRLANFLQQLHGADPLSFLIRMLEIGSAGVLSGWDSHASGDPLDVAAQYFVEHQATIHAAFDFHGKRELAPCDEDVTRLEGLILRAARIKFDPDKSWQQLRDELDAEDTVWYTDTPLLDEVSLKGSVLRCGLPELSGWKTLVPNVGSGGAIQAILASR